MQKGGRRPPPNLQTTTRAHPKPEMLRRESTNYPIPETWASTPATTLHPTSGVIIQKGGRRPPTNHDQSTTRNLKCFAGSPQTVPFQRDEQVHLRQHLIRRAESLLNKVAEGHLQTTTRANKQTHTHTPSHPNTQKHKQTNEQLRTNEQTYKQTSKQTNKHTNRQTDKHTHKQTSKQAHKQSDKRTNTQTNKQTRKKTTQAAQDKFT